MRETHIFLEIQYHLKNDLTKTGWKTRASTTNSIGKVHILKAWEEVTWEASMSSSRTRLKKETFWILQWRTLAVKNLRLRKVPLEAYYLVKEPSNREYLCTNSQVLYRTHWTFMKISCNSSKTPSRAQIHQDQQAICSRIFACSHQKSTSDPLRRRTESDVELEDALVVGGHESQFIRENWLVSWTIGAKNEALVNL